MNISIVFPVFPPSIDGIGDHTANLACALAASANVTVLTGAEPHDGPQGVSTKAVFSSDARLSAANLERELLTSRPDWIIVQYNPFSYGKWGYNPHFAAAIARVRKAGLSKIALMVHEPWVPPENVKFRVMRMWQKWQLKTLMAASDLAFFSITEWTTEFSRLFPGKEIVHLPIGSNIPIETGDVTAVRHKYHIAEDDIVLGLFGSGHPNRLFPFIHEAVSSLRRTGHNATLLYVGGSSDKLKAVFRDTKFLDAGKLPAGDVSLHLQAMDVYLCPFGKGVSSRRGSFMAGIQHGLPCVTTFGSQSDSFLQEYQKKAFLASPDTSIDDFCANVDRLYSNQILRDTLAEGGQRLYQDRFEWDMIGAKALAAIRTIDSRQDR